jgi:hypothetical protein
METLIWKELVTYEEGEKMAMKNGLTFIETSAKDYSKVE